MSDKNIDLFIVGAQKAGTTSLLNYLQQHPEICSHKEYSEFTFFSHSEHQFGIDYAFEKYFPNHSHSKKVIAKHAMLMYAEDAIKRLAEAQPNAKIVLMTREPVKRTFSAYHYARSIGRESIKSFEFALEKEKERINEEWEVVADTLYMKNSSYVEHYKTLLKYFPKEQIYIYDVSEFKSKKQAIVEEVLGLVDLKIDPQMDLDRVYNEGQSAKSEELMLLYRKFFVGMKKLKNSLNLKVSSSTYNKMRTKLYDMNKTDRKQQQINPATQAKLIQHFKPLNEELFELIGKRFDSWTY